MEREESRRLRFDCAGRRTKERVWTIEANAWQRLEFSWQSVGWLQSRLPTGIESCTEPFACSFFRPSLALEASFSTKGGGTGDSREESRRLRFNCAGRRTKERVWTIEANAWSVQNSADRSPRRQVTAQTGRRAVRSLRSQVGRR